MTSSPAVILERLAVPFFDPGPSFSELKSTLIAEISELIDSGAFINGPQVAAFETAFGDYCGADHCVGVASGLDALRLGLMAAGIEPGDEVIVPANTFVATLEGVTQAGGVPVLADISEDDYNIDRAAVEAALTDRTQFLMPVHLYGQMADMRALRDHCRASWSSRSSRTPARRHGAERDGLRAGASGLAAAFSFYPAKNLGAMGDAGALVTTTPRWPQIARALREHGQTRKYHHEREGFTARLDTIQAIVLLHKLPLLDRWTEQRRAAAAAYREALDGIGDLVPASRRPWQRTGLAPLRRAHTGAAAAGRISSTSVGSRRVGTIRSRRTCLRRMPGSAMRKARSRSPSSCAASLLSLPIFPGISENQIAAVVDAVTEYFA